MADLGQKATTAKENTYKSRENLPKGGGFFDFMLIFAILFWAFSSTMLSRFSDIHKHRIDSVLAVIEHGDFGWGGQHNGYYTSGVFKLNDQDAEYDHPEMDNNRKTHYNNYKRILSYD